jgi:hypothetical protein
MPISEKVHIASKWDNSISKEKRLGEFVLFAKISLP